MTRIGQIRDIIVAAGGKGSFYYYADGPGSGLGPSRGKGHRTGDMRVSYKIEAYGDGFGDDNDKRREVLKQLAELPGVEYTYLTGRSTRHMKIVFATKAR